MSLLNKNTFEKNNGDVRKRFTKVNFLASFIYRTIYTTKMNNFSPFWCILTC